MRDEAPMTFFWLTLMDDMSGWEPGDWRDPGKPQNAAAMDLLRLCGEAYLPFFKANAAALREERDEVALEIWGTEFRQQSFRYQAKCYRLLRERFADLAKADRKSIASVLEEIGYLEFLV